MDLKKVVRDIPDFPKPGILFRDITPILHDAKALKTSVDLIAEKVSSLDFDYVAGPESRGFIYGVPISYNLEKGFIPVRKRGKLPFKTISESYDLEYGQAVIEIHEDAIRPGQRIVVIDDLLATGGTAVALANLINRAGGEIVAMVFLIELEDLKGRDALKQYNVHSILKY